VRKSTWLAVIVCLVTVVVPGLFIGGLLKLIYIAGLKVGGLPDPLSLHMIFGIDTLRNVVMWVLIYGVGEAFHEALPRGRIGRPRVLVRAGRDSAWSRRQGAQRQSRDR
jgi:hypothetical protein